MARYMRLSAAEFYLNRPFTWAQYMPTFIILRMDYPIFLLLCSLKAKFSDILLLILY